MASKVKLYHTQSTDAWNVKSEIKTDQAVMAAVAHNKEYIQIVLRQDACDLLAYIASLVLDAEPTETLFGDEPTWVQANMFLDGATRRI